MTASYRKIDYRLRPGKYVERLMLCESFGRTKFSSPENYQYIGMGSLFFADFHLFHKSLGIEKMVSIEANISDKQRFENNRPFKNVKLIFEKTGSALKKVDLKQKSVVWFDYDGRLSNDVLDDISEVASNISSGSFLVFTVQAQPQSVNAAGEGPLKQLQKEVDPKKLPVGLSDTKLRGWKTAEVFRELMENEINRAVKIRNTAISDDDPYCYKPLFHFHYKDGASMLTMGGMIIKKSEETIFEACNFKDLLFTRDNGKPFTINVPNLTFRELKALEAQMPEKNTRRVKKFGMPEKDVSDYMKIYRYLPNFTAVEAV